MAVSWGNVERFDERAGIRRSGCGSARRGPRRRPGTAIPRRDAGGESLWEIKAGAHDQAS